MLEPEGSVQKDHQASTCFCETTMNSTDEVQKVDLKRSQHCKSLSNLVLRFHSDKCEVDASAAKVKGTLGSDSSVYQERMQMSCNSDTSPLKLKRSARTELPSGDCLVEGKDCYQGVASCSIFNSKVGQLSKTQVPFSPISLHMKFPKNFNLPSKEQLIKKFSVFGSVDSCRTRVFCFTGSAQVAFLREADAVAAYQYAKKKVLFGDANVRIWLDPFEHNRRGFKCSAHVPPSASKQIERRGFMCSAHVPPSTNKQIGRRGFNCSAHVPLSASKQIGPPLKSCLKNSNSLRQENRKKRCRVRCMAPIVQQLQAPPPRPVILPTLPVYSHSNQYRFMFPGWASGPAPGPHGSNGWLKEGEDMDGGDSSDESHLFVLI
ncbi:Serine/threonine-protein kinase ATM [Spatholobus suberectus]|nr:Serine/threonine-protein kinase ATM [Spatholobus suberectus]